MQVDTPQALADTLMAYLTVEDLKVLLSSIQSIHYHGYGSVEIHYHKHGVQYIDSTKRRKPNKIAVT